jgi:putative nucleotidyltransferase with HDIG domain
MRGEANLGPDTTYSNCASPTCPSAARENRKKRVMSIVADALPTPQGRIFDLVRLLAEPVKDLKAITEIVRQESLLNTQIMDLVTSSTSADVYEAPHFSDALVLVGSERLSILAAGCAVAEFAGRRLPAETIRDFWYHSLLTALLSEKIAREVHPESIERAYLAGLLHDIGRLPFLIALHDEEASLGKPVVQLQDQPASERNYFDLDHCEVGRWIAFSGNFSPWMRDVIEHHHDPSLATEDPQLVAIVAAADRSNAALSQFDPQRTRSNRLLREIQKLESHLVEGSSFELLTPNFWQ